MVKKAIMLILVLALAITMVALLPGCGEDPNKETAESLMREGDAAYDKVEVSMSSLAESQTEIATAVMGGDLSSVTGEAGAALTEELMGIMEDMQSNLMAARMAYESIMELEGVEDYKEYASAMIDVVDKTEEEIVAIEGLMAAFQELIAQAEAGEQVDIMALMESEEMTAVTELTEEVDSLKKEADKIKSDKGL